jgi:membrane associated rhomboid family serine protease
MLRRLKSWEAWGLVVGAPALTFVLTAYLWSITLGPGWAYRSGLSATLVGLIPTFGMIAGLVPGLLLAMLVNRRRDPRRMLKEPVPDGDLA